MSDQVGGGTSYARRIPPLPHAPCSTCGQLVPLGYYGECIPFHWLPTVPGAGRGRRRSCSGQGTLVKRSEVVMK